MSPTHRVSAVIIDHGNPAVGPVVVETECAVPLAHALDYVLEEYAVRRGSSGNYDFNNLELISLTAIRKDPK